MAAQVGAGGGARDLGVRSFVGGDQVVVDAGLVVPVRGDALVPQDYRWAGRVGSPPRIAAHELSGPGRKYPSPKLRADGRPERDSGAGAVQRPDAGRLHHAYLFTRHAARGGARPRCRASWPRASTARGGWPRWRDDHAPCGVCPACRDIDAGPLCRLHRAGRRPTGASRRSRSCWTRRSTSPWWGASRSS